MNEYLNNLSLNSKKILQSSQSKPKPKNKKDNQLNLYYNNKLFTTNSFREINNNYISNFKTEKSSPEKNDKKLPKNLSKQLTKRFDENEYDYFRKKLLKKNTNYLNYTQSSNNKSSKLISDSIKNKSSYSNNKSTLLSNKDKKIPIYINYNYKNDSKNNNSNCIYNYNKGNNNYIISSKLRFNSVKHNGDNFNVVNNNITPIKYENLNTIQNNKIISLTAFNSRKNSFEEIKNNKSIENKCYLNNNSNFTNMNKSNNNSNSNSNNNISSINNNYSSNNLNKIHLDIKKHKINIKVLPINKAITKVNSKYKVITNIKIGKSNEKQDKKNITKIHNETNKIILLNKIKKGSKNKSKENSKIKKNDLSIINKILSDIKNNINSNSNKVNNNAKNKCKNIHINNNAKNLIIKTQLPTKKNSKTRLNSHNNSNSNVSITIQTVHDNNYYLNECKKLTNYLKDYYKNNKEYPKTDLSFYKFGRIIGRGSFGKVNIGLNILTGRLVAIKSFNKQSLNNDGSKRKITYETNLMRNLSHKNITKILEMFESEKYILIIMEYISGGTLHNLIKKRGKLSEKTSRILFCQLIDGIRYMHNKNIIHRDIKLENILLDINNNIKICDFGVGKKVISNSLLFDQCGTPIYMAPEIIKNEGYFGFPVDIWSAGIVLYIMLTGNFPFTKTEEYSLEYDILNNQPNLNVFQDNNIKDLIKRLLEKDPNKRIKIEEVINHPWINCDGNGGDFAGKGSDIENKYHLFTNNEMVILNKNHVDYRYASNEDLCENFTMDNLNTVDEAENNNIKTKSLILAPYNTIKTESNESGNSIYNSKLKIKNNIIQFNYLVRQYNINYEINNNEEIDNGMLIDSMMDISNYDEDDNNNNNNQNNNIYNNSNINNFYETEDNIINENIVNKVCDLGFTREYVNKCLINNLLCHATAAYYLFSNYEKN